MFVRFGYVAMSTIVKNASPSKTMTFTNFNKLSDREAAIRKLERIGIENLHNTLRLLRHNRAHDIKLYRFSSKLIPLLGHEDLGDWNPIADLAGHFKAIGDYVKEHEMRVSFHPDHFTVLSTPRADILHKSIADLTRHVEMLDTMGLDERTKCNIHMGGTYGNKDKAYDRFIKQFSDMPAPLKQRITLENDDKTFTAKETLEACEALNVPMVLDIHHHVVNHAGEQAAELWPRIEKTWGGTNLPPKIHVSSPKSEKDPRGHADFLTANDVFHFLKSVSGQSKQIDVMIEAKKKDEALFQLMKHAGQASDITVLDQASLEI
jgi:UV DNA damage endonuclease